MFVILLNYIKPLSDVEEFIDDHREFLKQHYASGKFLLSGRREPRTGGVILATGTSRVEIECNIQNDPFNREKIAAYEIVEFLPTMTAPFLGSLKV